MEGPRNLMFRKRKLQQVRNGFLISVPVTYIVSMGLKKGDQLTPVMHYNGCITYMPEKREVDSDEVQQRDTEQT